MTAIDLLKLQLKFAHDTQEATIGDVDEAAAHFNETGKALSAGAAYAHSVMSEDMIVSMMLANKTALAETEPETGLSEPMPSMEDWAKHKQWVKTVKIDLPKFKQFAQKVYQATNDYLDTLTDEDLDKELDLPGMGKQSIPYVLSNFVILHIANLTGEISAAKGIQGLKGYPF